MGALATDQNLEVYALNHYKNRPFTVHKNLTAIPICDKDKLTRETKIKGSVWIVKHWDRNFHPHYTHLSYREDNRAADFSANTGFMVYDLQFMPPLLTKLVSSEDGPVWDIPTSNYGVIIVEFAFPTFPWLWFLSLFAIYVLLDCSILDCLLVFLFVIDSIFRDLSPLGRMGSPMPSPTTYADVSSRLSTLNIWIKKSISTLTNHPMSRIRHRLEMRIYEIF